MTQSDRINGKDLRDAIYSALELAGDTAREIFMDDLRRNGIDFVSGKTYTLVELEKILQNTFGIDGASLVMDKIEKYLQDD